MNEGYKVILNLIQVDEDGDTSRYEVKADARFAGNEDEYRITYYDYEQDNPNCLTTIEVIDKDFITVSRRGNEIRDDIVLEKDVRHVSIHVTPFGSIKTGMKATEISSDIDASGGNLHFRYVVDSNMKFINDITFDIKLIRKA